MLPGKLLAQYQQFTILWLCFHSCNISSDPCSRNIEGEKVQHEIHLSLKSEKIIFLYDPKWALD